MKTSELKNKLNNISGIRALDKSFIRVLDSESKCICEIGTFVKWLHIYNNCPDEVAQLLFEYYFTPLEEREEEKKYILKFPSCFDEFKYLSFNNIAKKYGRSMQSFASLNDVKTIFTQKEIDAMPFDTSFFIKEEVI